MRNFVFVILFFASSYFICGCEIINPKEDIPAYVYIKKPKVVTNYTVEGTDSQAIPDVWLSIGADERGAYPSGSLVPVLKNGTQTLQFDGGIVVNGTRDTRYKYDFFATFKDTVDLEPNVVDTIQPIIRYVKGAQFVLKEDFDGAGIIWDDHLGSAKFQVIAPSSADSYQGQSGLAVLDATHPDFKAFTSQAVQLPKGGLPVFLEMHYKCTGNLTVGIGTETGGSFSEVPYLTVYPTDHWKKLYVNLTPIVGSLSSGTTVKLLLSAQKPTDQTEARFWVDNIKVVY